MKIVLFIIIISCFSLIIISCGDDKEEYSATGTTDNTTTTDTTAPVVAEVTAVTTPTNDNTPSYTFSSTEAGTITYGGSCSSATTSATTGNNTVTFSELADGTYSDCTITVTDSATNTSSTLNVNTFIVDTTSQTLYGTSGDDTFNGGAGSDTLFGYAGNDVFNVTDKSGTFSDTIDGGSGTDTLNVSYSVDLVDFSSLSYDGGTGSTGTHTWVDANGGTINFKNIENLTVNGVSYQIKYTDGWGPWSDSLSPGVASMYYASSTKTALMFESSNYANLSTSRLFSTSENMTIIGSDGSDMIMHTSSSLGAMTLRAGKGDDYINVSNNTKADTVYGGADNDTIYIHENDLTNDLVIDGGDGTDTLAFNFAGAVIYTLNENVPTNFENLVGSTNNDNLTGDGNANEIRGGKGSDTLYGGGGNDVLYGGITAYQSASSWNDESSYSGYPGYSGGQGGGLNKSTWYAHSGDGGADKLYGGAGNDTLYGASGDDTLDGGTGTDTLAGGSGTDTFIIRSGDGSSELTDADIILDFQDGTDVIGLDGGLTFNDLTIAQGSGSNSSHTTIRITSSGEYLAIVENISVSNISEADFSIMN